MVREHGLIGRAVAHAQACDDVSAAIEMISPQVIAMTEIGQFETVRSWFDGFDDLQVERHAPLAVGAAWLASLAGETERAAHFTQAARRGAWEGPMPDGTASLESALALLSSAFGLGGLTGMRGAAEQAVAFEAAGSPWRLLSLTLLGVALTLDHELPPARAALAEAVQLIEGPSAIGSIALSYLARVNLFEGDEPGAYQHVERAFQVVSGRATGRTCRASARTRSRPSSCAAGATSRGLRWPSSGPPTSCRVSRRCTGGR